MVRFDEKLEKIYCFEENSPDNIIYDMSVCNMERCVRSCITEAFEANKGIFKRKPKAARCFSILQHKKIDNQKTFDVECEMEEDCIKYVDLITTLIHNHISKGVK